jgi:hypothetical protein
MSRIVAFVIVSIAIDAVVCPVVCLNLEAPSHQTSSVPSQGVGCAGGFCVSGLLPVRTEQPETLTPTAVRFTERHTFRPGLDPTADIDHPPRFV